MKKYPDRFKEQRRSVSAQGRAEKEFEEAKNKLSDIQNKKDQRKLDPKEVEQAAENCKEKETLLKTKSINFGKELKQKNRTHHDEVKNVLISLNHARISYHATALQLYTEAYKEILSIQD